ncbi:hypothetical protein M758_UG034500 [Ceratodon purpureus]|nr:hypothetical protein M758_UG034500 [Ceratodon purpureus]
MHVNFDAQITGSWNRMTKDALGRAVRKDDSTREREIHRRWRKWQAVSDGRRLRSMILVQ